MNQWIPCAGISVKLQSKHTAHVTSVVVPVQFVEGCQQDEGGFELNLDAVIDAGKLAAVQAEKHHGGEPNDWIVTAIDFGPSLFIAMPAPGEEVSDGTD